ncbi:hypothetical protein RAHE111665_16430 [Rariglobus hedericola]
MHQKRATLSHFGTIKEQPRLAFDTAGARVSLFAQSFCLTVGYVEVFDWT